MTTNATLAEFQNAEQALVRLVLPHFSAEKTFRLSSSAYLGLGNGQAAIEAWGLTVDDFPSPDDFEAAKASPIIWCSDLLMRPRETDDAMKMAASTLAGILGHLGDNGEIQQQACQAFEQFFSTTTLALNDYLNTGDSSMQEALETEEWLRQKRFPHYPPLFNDTAEEQADWAEAQKHGIWTVVDQGETMTLAAASTPQKALAKAWKIVPELAPMRRLQALDDALPAPRKGPPGSRF
jgi:hypothetical protein